MTARLAPLLAVALAACLDPGGTAVYFDLSTDREGFFDAPWPSDLRLDADGAPDLGGFPNPKSSPIVDNLLAGAADRRLWPAMAVTLFRFDGPLAPRRLDRPIAASADAPVLLIDIDPDSPDRGRLFPTAAATLEPDDYLPEYGLAVAPWPGVVLPGGRLYGVVVLRELGDAGGEPLAVPDPIADLAAGRVPDGTPDAALELYRPLFVTLDQLGIDRAEVAAATAFTTADAPRDLAAISDAAVAAHDVRIDQLVLADAGHERFCELVGSVDLPQFQTGEPPFNSGGQLALDASGAPVEQRRERAPVRLVIPKQPMPEGGYPLVLYIHGSGGTSDYVIDRGPIVEPGGERLAGRGPAHHLAHRNIAVASSAMPVNPERVAGASKFEYVNFSNLRAMRDTFRQGAIEQRLLLEALVELEIDPGLLDDCAGPSLPAGATGFGFDGRRLAISGQSMGGMYTNMVGAIEPAFEVAVPTGAGGFWNRFVLDTDLIDSTPELLGVLIGARDLSFVHPALQLAALAWEGAEPIVYMPRLARRPLPGHPVRSIYQPVGHGDLYFSPATFDAAAMAYGTRQAGAPVWDSMQTSLAIDDRGGLAPYPVANNARAADGTLFTGVVVQFAGDGLDDPHRIFTQLDAVKHQYGCFLESYFAGRAPSVPAPAGADAPCPK